MNLKVKPSRAAYIFIMLFVLNVYYSLFRTNYANLVQVALAVYAVYFLFVSGKRFKIQHIFQVRFCAFCVPMIVITFASIVTAKFVHRTEVPSDINQTLVRCFYYIVAFIIAYYSVYLFGNETPKLIIISGLIAYATVFIQYIAGGGISGLIHFMNNKVNGISLEVHNLTYCFGFFFVYYLLSDQYTSKYKRRSLVILGICIFFGNKRALYLALLISLGVYFLFHKFKEKRLGLLRFVFVVYIAGTFLYLWLIKSGTFQMMLVTLNINDMSRFLFWNYFIDDYELSPMYWGRGISYTDNIMALSSTMHEMRIAMQTNIHNDILRAYIGWGCIPYLYYLVNFFLLRIRRFIKDNNESNGWRYFAIASLYLFINFFDNMLTAVDFNICFFVVFLLLSSEGRVSTKYGRTKTGVSCNTDLQR